MLSAITLRHLVFSGSKVVPVGLSFLPGVNLVYGASNTGKSFTLKAIDFMLGSSKKLPSFAERDGYESVWLGFELANKAYTLYRGISGGKFALYEGLKDSLTLGEQKPIKMLEPTHDSVDRDNISTFFLEKIELDHKKVARDANGKQENLSFRDLASVFIVDETGIQMERSPIEGGQHVDVPFERGVFRLLLSGLDDSAVIPVTSPKDFKADKVARTAMLDELIKELDAQITNYFPEPDKLHEQDERLEEKLKTLQSKFDPIQDQLDKFLNDRAIIMRDIPVLKQRTEEVTFHLSRFGQLNEIYKSDIERLETIEESGFLLSIEEKQSCPLCGAAPDAQKHEHHFINAENIGASAKKEIAKIKSQMKDLSSSVKELEAEKNELIASLSTRAKSLKEVEDEITSMAPILEENNKMLLQIISSRDHVKNGLRLIKQKQELENRVALLKALKGTKKKDKPKFILADNLAHDFCTTLSNVLKEWEFPGQRQVSFDTETYDVKIDGKLRTDNGKGVRAITHAAFKVALLIFCRERNLPHPGIVILDTPLLTYRDPIKNPKFGELAPDEVELAKKPIKENFFRHLATLKEMGQFIVLENVDPPADISAIAHVDTFYGEGSTIRVGLFPPKVTEDKPATSSP